MASERERERKGKQAQFGVRLPAVEGGVGRAVAAAAMEVPPPPPPARPAAR